MCSDTVVEVVGLCKTYTFYKRGADRLKETLAQPFAHAVGRTPPQFSTSFCALRDVDFQIRRGESVGIVGPNGSGKSTLLQLIYGTLRPTEGKVAINGRIVALLELGAGFHPEYTGRENARLAGALNGLSSSKVEQWMAEVEAFADLGEFFDRPVKLYSSGMYVRLAFAAAIHCDPDIVIIDEALAVGDHYFQAKCYEKLKSLLAKRTTLLFVSHAMGIVKALCDRALVLHRGRLVFDGSVDKASDCYVSLCRSSQAVRTPLEAPPAGAAAAASPDSANAGLQVRSTQQPPFESRYTQRFGSGAARFVDCLLLQDDQEVATMTTGRHATIRAVLEVVEDCPMPGEVGAVVSTLEGIELFALNSLWEGMEVPPLAHGRTYLFDFDFEVPLGCDAKYRIDLGYRMPIQGEYVDKVLCGAVFDVRSNGPRDVQLLFRVPASVRVREAEIGAL